MSRYRTWIAAAFLLLPACGKESSSSNEATPQATTTSVTTSTSSTAATLCGVGLDVTPETTVATVNGKAIPCSELFALTSPMALASEAEFREGLRGMHKQGLSNLIDERLLQAAADEKKQSISDFVASTLTIQPATPEEAQAFYDQAVAQGEKLPPFEEITDELFEFINERKQKTELANFRASLRAKADIAMSLPLVVPPKFVVDATGPSRGNDAAVVTIVEFSDYQCGFCGKAEPTVHKLLEDYGDKVRLVYRDYPLPNHTDAPKASEAAHCAGKQDKFWEMHDLLFQNQRSLGVDALKGYAQTIGLKSEEFVACLDSGEMKPIVVASLEEGEKVGVNGTPAFFVNGRLLSGAQSLERFKEVIDYELEQANAK